MLPCAGVIIFNKKLDTILVKTHENRYSFPKGKREKKESQLDNALREMSEETGIMPSGINIIPNKNFVELSEKGNPCVLYYIAFLKSENKIDFKFDPEELANVSFYSVDEALKLDGFKDSRKKILQEAYEFIKSKL